MFTFFEHNEERVLIHCACGIQRTGVCIYTMLRWTGIGPSDCYDTMLGMREEMAVGVGEWRIDLCEKNLVSLYEGDVIYKK